MMSKDCLEEAPGERLTKLFWDSKGSIHLLEVPAQKNYQFLLQGNLEISIGRNQDEIEDYQPKL